MRRFACALLLLAGCHSSTGSSSSQITYWKDVKPIADTKCVGCHSPDNIAPFTLQSYADFKAQTDKVHVAVVNKVMPPWPPGANCADYQDDRSLSDAQIATITGWIDQGAVEGDPKDYKPGTLASAGLTRVDSTLQIAQPYTPTLAPDEYRCFVMDWPQAADAYRDDGSGGPDRAARERHHEFGCRREHDQCVGCVREREEHDDRRPERQIVKYEQGRGAAGGRADERVHAKEQSRQTGVERPV